jgi:hypothetical protein
MPQTMPHKTDASLFVEAALTSDVAANGVDGLHADALRGGSFDTGHRPGKATRAD